MHVFVFSVCLHNYDIVRRASGLKNTAALGTSGMEPQVNSNHCYFISVSS